MSRRPAIPTATAADRVRALLALSAGKPCPTLTEMAGRLGVTEHAVRAALRELARLRQIRAQQNGCGRRVRVLVLGGQWSAWTKWTRRAQKSSPTDHVARVLQSGSYENARQNNEVTFQAA
jgi:DNA-binding FadR family transcriptional regulator